MIIRSSKALKSNKNTLLNNFDEKPAIVNEEVKPLDNEIIQKKPKRKKPTPIAVEEPIVVEEKTEDEDLSKWLEEHTED